MKLYLVKKFIIAVLLGIFITTFAWIFASFVDVNMHNVTDHKFQNWNIFAMIEREYDRTH